jgi:DDE superfamily endonuclease
MVLIVDENTDAKSSADCAGAARQYSGTLGGVALCQVAVTLTCAVPAGHAMIGRALYLPVDWAADGERRELAGVPDEIMFATKPELAGACCGTPMTGASAPGSSSATKCMAALTCARASGNAGAAWTVGMSEICAFGVVPVPPCVGRASASPDGLGRPAGSALPGSQQCLADGGPRLDRCVCPGCLR